MGKHDNQGFTLIEFLVTMAIAALLMFVAVPGFYGIIQNNKIVTMTNKLSATFNFARSEAIRIGANVSVCPAANAALSSCGGAANWANGWIVFADPDGNNAIDSSNDILKVNEALPVGTSVTASAARVTYDASGFVSSNAFTISVAASGCYGKNGRVINIAASGRLAITYTTC